jgi:thiosulfate/3-mercaptopyruvate sulfurtransferase
MVRQVALKSFFLLVVVMSSFAAAPVYAGQSDWVVSAKEAKKLIEADKATVLDTRGKMSWIAGHVPRSAPVKWQDFSRTKAPYKGELLRDDAKLTQKLQELGVSKGRAVLVVGKPPKNWGEDGRIVWMLRTLGHSNAALVEGGYSALKKAGVDTTLSQAKAPRGDFVVKRTGKYDIDRDTLRKKYKSKDYVLVDTREPREYRGKTPYGESRGGHVPGAKHLYYTDLMDSKGRILPKAKIQKKLKALGVTPDKTIVAYCTGGVRSAWLVAVLADLGYPNAVNYAGSMWEWSAGDEKTYPLEK